MNTTNNPLVGDCSVENSLELSKISGEIASENSLKHTDTYFRDSIIEMVKECNYKKEYAKNAFNATIETHERLTNFNHFISYKGKLYQRDEFLYTFFADYKKYKKRVKFLDDNIMYLSSNQRNKLQYHILSQKYKLLEISEKDKEELYLFCKKYKGEHEQAAQWFNRMAWIDGHEKIITFGVSLEVQGVNKGVWCYTSDIRGDSADFSGVVMTWETWLQPIAAKLDDIRKQIQRIPDKKQRERYCGAAYEDIKPMLYYQDYKHLTLPQDEITKLRAWVFKYLDKGVAPLPYSGNMPLADMQFTIDYEKDIEIVTTLDLKNSARMAEYNRLNNDRHNKEMGKRRSRETFNRLVGDEWTTAEIRAQGFTDRQIRTWRDYGWIEIIGKKGNALIYKRVL